MHSIFLGSVVKTLIPVHTSLTLITAVRNDGFFSLSFLKQIQAEHLLIYNPPSTLIFRLYNRMQVACVQQPIFLPELQCLKESN